MHFRMVSKMAHCDCIAYKQFSGHVLQYNSVYIFIYVEESSEGWVCPHITVAIFNFINSLSYIYCE